MKYFVLASLLCLSACSDDNDNKNNETPQNLAELTVDASEISIAQGDTRTVKITSGNGEYEVTSANEEVVTAEVDGDIVTLTAVEGHNNAQGVVYVKDKYYQRAKILVNTAAEFDLKLNKTLFTLYSQVEGADEAFVKIYTGNGGYSLEVIDENNCIEVDQSTLEDSESFTVKGIAQGNAEVKITDRKGKEAFVNLNVIAPKQITTDADEKGVLINANQGSQQVKILSGNGEYKILDAGDTKVVRLELYGNVVTVTGRKAGETSFTLTDAKGQVSQPIQVKIAPDKRWCMNLGRDYAVWTHFGEMTGEGVEALKAATNDFKLKKMTWELTCRIDNTYWLQTIMEIMLNVEGQDYDVLIKEVDYNSMKRCVDEIDFQALVSTEKVHSTAAVVIENREKVLEGALQECLEEIEYKALPAALVDHVNVDVAGMKVGDVIRVKDLEISKNPDIDVHKLTKQ